MFLLSAPRHGPLILKRCKPPLTAEGMTSNKAETWMLLWKASPGWAEVSMLVYSTTRSFPAHPWMWTWTLPAALHAFYNSFFCPRLLRLLSRYNTWDKILIVGNYVLHRWDFAVGNKQLWDWSVKARSNIMTDKSTGINTYAFNNLQGFWKCSRFVWIFL